MQLTVIGSSSEGNAYVLQNGGEALLIEAGRPFKKVLEALDYDLAKIAGCLITHEHGDHAGRVNEYLSNGVRIYASKGTCDALTPRVKGNYHLTPINAREGEFTQFNCGNFTITPFPTRHDAAEPVGFMIWHEETGGILFATDTSYLPSTFSHLSNVLIECNYDRDRLNAHLEDGLDPDRYRRVLASHMGYDTCRDALLANDLTAVNNIVLIHVSKDHGEADKFRAGIQKATGKTVHVAAPGMTIKFNKTPF